MSGTEKSCYQTGAVRDCFDALVKRLNEISEDPLNEEKDDRIRVPFFPLTWDISQFYFLLKEFYRLKLFDNMAFIITNRDYSEIQEIFLFKFIETDEEEIGTGRARLKFQIQPIEDDIESDIMKKLNQLVADFDVEVFKFLQNYLCLNFKFDIGQLFILREAIANVGILKETDYINSDVIRYLKDFFSLMRKGLSEQHLEKMPVIQYSTKENRENPIVNFFIKFGRDWADVEIDEFFDVVAEIFESKSYNFLIFNDEDRPIAICRATFDSGILHFNPVPIHFLKDFLIGSDEMDPREMTKSLYSHTKITTIPMRMSVINNYLADITQPKCSFVEGILSGTEFLYREPIYPDSILKTLLKRGFGIKFDKLIPGLENAIKKAVEYYGRILFVNIKKRKEGGKCLQNIFDLFVEDGCIQANQLNIEGYLEIFKDKKTTIAINELKSAVEKSEGCSYGLMVTIKLDEFTEIFSVRNLESLMEMTKFMQSLPSLEKISVLLKKISESDMDKLEEPDKQAQLPEQEEFLEGVPSLNHFLTKGIMIKVAEDKSFIQVRDEEYSDQGYLGMSIQRLKEFINENFPDILE